MIASTSLIKMLFGVHSLPFIIKSEKFLIVSILEIFLFLEYAQVKCNCALVTNHTKPIGIRNFDLPRWVFSTM